MIKLFKNRGFTDKLYFINFVVVMVLVEQCITLIFLSGLLHMSDSALATIQWIVTSAFAELGLHTGLIVWKAKYENSRKFKDVNLMDILSKDVQEPNSSESISQEVEG